MPTYLSKDRVRTGLRWTAVLPGAFLAAFLATFPIHWVVMLIHYFGNARDDSFLNINGKTGIAVIPWPILERWGYAFCTPLILVLVGSHIAPYHKRETGIAMAIVWGLAAGWALAISIINPLNKEQHEYWPITLTIAICLGIGGVGTGLYKVFKTHPPQ